MKIFSLITDFLWSGPILLLLLSAHFFFTFRLFPQRQLLSALKLSVTPEKSCGMNGFRTLATTLAATLGTGNIVGVSTAIALGGPGALFWCFLTGILGMATVYAECYLSCFYAKKTNAANGCGTVKTGGPMYVMEHGLHSKKLGLFYALCVTVAAFGVGATTQVCAMADAAKSTFFLSPHLVGIAAAILTGLVVLGGIKSIGTFCSKLVPPLSFLYMAACVFLLWQDRHFLPNALRLMLSCAFQVKSCAGGLLGSSFLLAARFGIARGLFTNEAGIGTSAITAGSAMSENPMRQALISMTAVFWDTVVMCTLTGLVILCAMISHPGCMDACSIGGYTGVAFSFFPYFGKELLSLALIAFALATLVGWCYLGQEGFVYVFGADYLKTYHLLYIVMIYLGAILPIGFIFSLTDFINALMVPPSVLTLFLLHKKIKAPESKNLPK